MEQYWKIERWIAVAVGGSRESLVQGKNERTFNISVLDKEMKIIKVLYVYGTCELLWSQKWRHSRFGSRGRFLFAR